MKRSVKPEHTEDLGGVVVKVINAVVVQTCANCGEEMTAIPDMEGLARATAIARALNPVCLQGREIKFMRRALDMTQKEFAEAMDLSAEHVSRWENDHKGVGEASERLVRHNICALLYKNVLTRAYDPAVIARMGFRKLVDGKVLPPIEMVRVRAPSDECDASAWDQAA